MKEKLKYCLRQSVSRVDIISLVFAFVMIWFGNILFAYYNSTLGAGENYFRYTSIAETTPYLSGIAIIITVWRFKTGCLKISLTDIFVLLGLTWVSCNHFSHEHSLFGGVEELVIFTAIYFTMRVFAASSDKCLKVLLLWFLIYGLGELYTGVKQIYGFELSKHRLGASGTFFNPGPYGGFVALLMPASLFMILSLREEMLAVRFRLKEFYRYISYKTVMYYISWITLLLSIIVLPATMSRTAWISAVVSMATVALNDKSVRAYIKHIFNRHKTKTIVIFSAFSVLLSAGCIAGYYMKKGSADGRLLLWRMSALAIKESPVTGYGSGRFGGVFAQTQAEYFASGERTEEEIMVTGKTEYAFNEYLQICVEHGLIGLLLFVAVIVAAFTAGFRSDYSERKVWCFVLLSLLIFAFASYPLNLTQFCVLTALILGALGGKWIVRKRWVNIMFFSVVNIFFLTVSVIIVSANDEKNPYYEEWTQENRYYGMGIYDKKMAETYTRLYPYLKGESEFLFEYGHTLNKVGEYEKSNEILAEGVYINSDPMFYNIMGNNYKALGQNDKAEEYYYHGYYVMPHRLYPLYLLFNLYYETGQSEKAKNMASDFLAKEPKVQSKAVKQMRDEINKKMNPSNR